MSDGSFVRLTVDSACSRRSLLRVGVLAGTGVGLSTLLRRRAVASQDTVALPQAVSEPAVIHIYLAGGPSHFETFDPKPAAPLDFRGPFAPIDTNVAGIRICETLPRLAELAQRYVLLRSCCHDNSGHGGAQRYVYTGYKSASPEFELPHDYPAAGSIVSKVTGQMRHGLPTYMQVGNGDQGPPAFLGPAYGAFEVYSTGKPVGLEVNPAVKLERLDDRRQLRADFDRLRRDGQSGQVMGALDDLERQAYEMLTSTTAHAAFDLKQESETLRARYGDHDAGRSCLLARRFIEAGAGFVSLRIGSWDHHGNAGGTVTSGANENCPPMDQAVSALIEDLYQRGLDRRVLLVLWGEFGRTPRVNNQAGRDHWPQAMSVLLSGGGLATGRVIGATTSKGEQPQGDPVSPADVLASVYRHLGIDTEQSFLNSAGRPIPILSHGRPIAGLT
jgi:hypothetical protein